MPVERASDVPQFFRLNIEVGDLTAAISFYTRLLGIDGRKLTGSRCYFSCGPVTLQVVDVSAAHPPHRPPRRFTSQSRIWSRRLRAPKSSIVSPRNRCTTHREAASS